MNGHSLCNPIKSDILFSMKTMTVTEVAQNFSSVMDGVESNQEEIVLIRDNKPVGRIVPEPPGMTALEVFADLYRTLDDETADELLKGINKFRDGDWGRIKELRDPWDS